MDKPRQKSIMKLLSTLPSHGAALSLLLLSWGTGSLSLAGDTLTGVDYTVTTTHVDHLGSTRLETDLLGQVTSRHTYYPFGEEVGPIPAYGASHRYTGHEWDDETGLDYMLARYYSTDLSRFLSVDPSMKIDNHLEKPQRWNRYAYVSNNPLAYVDPDGREQTVVVGGKSYMGGVDGMPVGSPKFSAALTIGVNAMGGITGASASFGIAADNQGNLGLIGTVQSRGGFGAEASADFTLSIQSGTVQDLAGGGQDFTVSAEVGEGGAVGVTLTDQGPVGVSVAYTVGVGGAVSVNEGGTGMVMLNDTTDPNQPKSTKKSKKKPPKPVKKKPKKTRRS